MNQSNMRITNSTVGIGTSLLVVTLTVLVTMIKRATKQRDRDADKTKSVE
jgi:hypothetical protein